MTIAANTEPYHNVVTNDEGVILLTSQMENAVAQAEQDFKQGKCLSEEDLRQRLAQWL